MNDLYFTALYCNGMYIGTYRNEQEKAELIRQYNENMDRTR